MQAEHTHTTTQGHTHVETLMQINTHKRDTQTTDRYMHRQNTHRDKHTDTHSHTDGQGHTDTD